MKEEKELTRNDWIPYYNRSGVWCEFLRDGKHMKAEIGGKTLMNIKPDESKNFVLSAVIAEALKNAIPAYEKA